MSEYARREKHKIVRSRFDGNISLRIVYSIVCFSRVYEAN